MDELCHFLHLTGYYRRCVPLFADITKPLNRILAKSTKFQCSAEGQSALEHLKETLYVKPILQYPNTGNPYTLFTDASHYA